MSSRVLPIVGAVFVCWFGCEKPEPAGSAKPVSPNETPRRTRLPADAASKNATPVPAPPKLTPAGPKTPPPADAKKLARQTLASLSVDLDGDGKPDQVTIKSPRLLSDTCATSPRVTIGGIELLLNYKDHEVQDMFAPKAGLPVSVVDVNRKDKTRELLIGPFQQCGPEYDNNGSEWLLLRYDGKRITKVWRDNTRTKKLTFAGNGRWTAERDLCVRGSKVKHEPKYRVLKMGRRKITRYRFVLVKGRAVAKKIRTYFKAEDCMNRFCPHVYVGTPLRYVGEILRDLRGSRSMTSQSLALPSLARRGTTVVVKLREFERETSFIDSVWLRVGDKVLRPTLCSSSPNAVCSDDRDFHVMHHGDELSLQFESVPEGALELWANGYYVLTGP